MTENNPDKNHDSSSEDENQKNTPPSDSLPPPSSDENNNDDDIVDETPEEIFSSSKHNMDYVTVKGVVLRTGYADKNNWYLLCIKELLDNAIDFLWKKYQGDKDAAIEVEITLTSDSLFHIKIRNTNSKNFEVFKKEDLDAILNYEMRYGSKQNQHIISRGMLGDVMKQIAAWPYVLIHTKDDGSAFIDKQWDKPLIIRFNGLERHVFIHVDKANQRIDPEIIPIPNKLSHTDTEIETTWPIIDEVQNSLDIHKVERFCRQYILFTTDISFKFKLIDHSPDKINNRNEDSRVYDTTKKEWVSELANVLTSPARKAAIKIDAPALHSISTKWHNIGTIHSYKPEEFVAAITGVHDKHKVTVYDALKKHFIETTQMKKTPDVDISIAKFLQDPDKHKKLQSLFETLRKILDPPKELSLPYSHIKKDDRKKALIDRIVQMYPEGYLDTNKAVYTSVPGEYDDKSLRKVWNHDGTLYSYQHGSGLLQFPFAFEMIIIPLDWDVIDQALTYSKYKPSEFIGAINYSISPRNNVFEGDYEWNDEKSGYNETARDIQGIFRVYKFTFGYYADSKIRLPCVIAANLISPRVDYHGHDKSRIDVSPFTQTIIEAVMKSAPKIQTYRAAGFTFYDERKHASSFRVNEDKKKETIDILTELLGKRKEAMGL